MMASLHINVWPSMMSSHGANPAFNKQKKKIRRPEHSLLPFPIKIVIPFLAVSC